MGFRSRKSIKVAPGVKLNVGKKSIGVSVGGKYGGVSVNSKTGARARVSAPGTGLSYTSKIGNTSPKKGSTKNKVSKGDQQKKPPTRQAVDKQAQYEEIVKKGNLNKKKAKSIQRSCTIIALSLILIGLLTISSGMLGIILIVVGIIFAYTAHMYKNIANTCFDDTGAPKASVSNMLPQQAKATKESSVKTETHRIAGVSYRQDAIKSLGTPNPDYRLTKEQLIKKNLLNVSIYEYSFKPHKAELVPEPTNEHDPNAIKVIIEGKHIGYIKKGSCAHVKKLMSTNSIKSITATMKGGNCKYISCYDAPKDRDKDSYNYSSDKFDIGVEIKIQTIG